MNKSEFIKNTSAVILCGGRSSRMNYSPKQHLKLGERSFLETILDTLRFFDEILISGDELSKSAKTVNDIYKNIGPIGGLVSCLEFTSQDQIFVIACDMPWVTKEFIEFMIQNYSKEQECLVPVFKGKVHPLCGIYKKSVLQKIYGQIKKNDYKLIDLLKQTDTHYLEISSEQKNNLLNVNTPQIYDELVKNK